MPLRALAEPVAHAAGRALHWWLRHPAAEMRLEAAATPRTARPLIDNYGSGLYNPPFMLVAFCAITLSSPYRGART